MPVDPRETSICSQTGLTRPECSCPNCLERILQQFQPGLVAADEPEIKVTRSIRGDGRTAVDRAPWRR